MSEYQYYEFLAIDRPLTSKEMSALRALSTRAHITPVSFTNEYQWGDFKGDPRKLMRRYFDAHVYVANWGTAIFMLRLPLEVIPEKTTKTLALDYVLDFEATATHQVITWWIEDSENYDRFVMEDGDDWMSRLAPVREELLRGDMRSLYLGWLGAVAMGIVDDDELEPLSAAGLGELTPAQEALAEFLDMDKDLLAVAGMGSPALKVEEPSPKEMDEWLGHLPREEMRDLLKQLLAGQGLTAERELKGRFSAWRRAFLGDGDLAPRRSAGELRKNAETMEQLRLERKKRDRERLELERRQKREAYLANLAKDFPKAWQALHLKVTARLYDEVCQALVDLSESYALHSSPEAFHREMQKFMEGYQRRKTLVERLKKAKVW